MTARMYYDDDADPSALAGQTVAIIGYGSQGHAHALNLHESGVDVVVGLAAGSKSQVVSARIPDETFEKLKAWADAHGESLGEIARDRELHGQA